MASSRLLHVVTILCIVTCSTSGELDKLAASTPTTCDPTLLGINGFDICLLDSTGNTLTSLLSVIDNDLLLLQNALSLGHCMCNQACQPSQIVCNDPKAINTVALLANLGHNAPLLNAVTEIVYNLENYQLYCFCPQYVTAAEACIPVTNPEKCEYPNLNSYTFFKSS